MTFTQGLHYTSIIQLKDLLNLIFQVAKRPDHLSYGTSGRLCVEHNCCPVVILAVRVCKEAYSHVGAQSIILKEKEFWIFVFQVHQFSWGQCHCWSSHL